MRHACLQFLLFAAVLGPGLPVVRITEAAPKARTPAEACSFLRGEGLSAGSWTNQYEDVFGCSSPYRELSAGSPLPNNLAYYVDGKKTTVSTVKLVLNVNHRATAAAAHTTLSKVAQSLSLRATGERLPAALESAIRNGSRASAKVGAAVVEVVRVDWPTGKGYEIKVTLVDSAGLQGTRQARPMKQ